MAPPVEAFPPQELSARVQYDARGKYRKGGPIELEKCKLLEMVQYACEVENRDDPRGRVMCRPLVRLFRRCANGLTVETTSWENLEHKL
ncbi:hypothetical protein B0J12DRAFT_564042 [Macrophomina phaseolina]|uniref:Mitochondrial export protein Som1 n=1 Tax=Macrophomina phaseolina TaxID=35725 RepID=A0ABQ8GUA6_9PEZI|nr:hypothetical protein B0J12DRAFT_564042 [Macrophomina phaseolina]